MRNTQNKNQQRKEANECVIRSLKAQLNHEKHQIHLTYRVGKTEFIVQNLSCKSSRTLKVFNISSMQARWTQIQSSIAKYSFF